MRRKRRRMDSCISSHLRRRRSRVRCFRRYKRVRMRRCRGRWLKSMNWTSWGSYCSVMGMMHVSISSWGKFLSVDYPITWPSLNSEAILASLVRLMILSSCRINERRNRGALALLPSDISRQLVLCCERESLILSKKSGWMWKVRYRWSRWRKFLDSSNRNSLLPSR